MPKEKDSSSRKLATYIIQNSSEQGVAKGIPFQNIYDYVKYDLKIGKGKGRATTKEYLQRFLKNKVIVATNPDILESSTFSPFIDDDPVMWYVNICHRTDNITFQKMVYFWKLNWELKKEYYRENVLTEVIPSTVYEGSVIYSPSVSRHDGDYFVGKSALYLNPKFTSRHRKKIDAMDSSNTSALCTFYALSWHYGLTYKINEASKITGRVYKLGSRSKRPFFSFIRKEPDTEVLLDDTPEIDANIENTRADILLVPSDPLDNKIFQWPENPTKGFLEYVFNMVVRQSITIRNEDIEKMKHKLDSLLERKK